MRTGLFFGLIFMFVSLLCCNKPADERQYRFPIIELNHCGDTSIDGQTLQICFDALLSDSRCPINAVCVWQGEATVKLSLHANGTEKSFKLSTINNPPTFRNDTTISGYKIKLVSVSPYPGSDPHTPYRIELSVFR
jgi:hypothetical protein